MKPEKISYTFLGSFLITIFCLQWYQLPTYPVRIKLLLCFLYLIYLLFFLHKSRKAPLLLAIALGVSAALCSVARTTHVPLPNTIDTYATNQYVTIEGTITDEPDRRPLVTKYTIAAKKITLNDGTVIPVEGRVLANHTRNWPPFEYGDHVIVKGTLEKPEQIETFHYDRYLSRYDIYSIIYRASITKNPSPHASRPSPYRFLFLTKKTFESQINRLYPEPHASFMAGLLTGSRKGIPEHLMQDFNTTGLTHIIAISGYNITIVISIIAGALFWLPLKWRFVPSVIAIIAFTLFVGASAAVVRASIMGILGLIALQTGRQTHVRLSVLWTLFFMLCWNPKYLWYDAGFQLSFLAVIGLVELGPLLDKWFTKVPQFLGIREALQMTTAAQLSAVPLIVLLFGRFSLVAPLANVLVAPLIPLAMLFGFLGVIASYLWFPLGQLIAYIGWGCLEKIIDIASTFADIPYASVNLTMSIWMIIWYYVLLIIWVWKNNQLRNLET